MQLPVFSVIRLEFILQSQDLINVEALIDRGEVNPHIIVIEHINWKRWVCGEN